MGIQSLGVGSGLDIKSLVQQLVAAERAPEANRLNRQQSSLKAQLSALGKFKSALSEFQGSLSALSSLATFAKHKATSSDTTLFTASADSTAAAPATYNIETIQTAVAQKSASTATYAALTDNIGQGSLTFTFNDPNKAAQTVTIDAAHSSVQGVMDAVNNANIGIRASVVKGSAGYQLVFSSQKTGTANGFSVSGLFNSGTTMNVLPGQAAQDAQIKVDGIAATSSTNNFTGVIPGVTIDVLKGQSGTTSTLTVGIDKTSISTAVGKLVDSYNKVVDTLNQVAGYDAKTKKAGPLLGDASVRGIQQRLRDVLGAIVPVSSGPYHALVDVGISTGKDGKLSLDKGKLGTALDTNFDSVGRLFAAGGKPSDPLVNYVGSSANTQVGSYAVNITQLATHGTYTGGAAGATFPFTATANDTFTISVDGVASKTINLNTATQYNTGADLAAEIQKEINGDSNLQKAGVSVSVSYNAGTFSISSDSYGSNSTVQITSVGSSTTADLGFTVAAGAAGADVAGSIGGVAATGAGQTLTAAGNAAGMQIKVIGGGTGSRGSVDFSRGVADKMNSLLDGLLGDGGIFSTRTKSYNEQLKHISDQRDALDRRMQAVQANYTAKFTAMDTLVAQLNSTGNYLSQQLAKLPG